MTQHKFKPADFVQTSLGKGFVKERQGDIYLIQLGTSRFRFRENEIMMIETRESRERKKVRR